MVAHSERAKWAHLKPDRGAQTQPGWWDRAV